MNLLNYVSSHRYKFIAGVLVILVIITVIIVSNTNGNVTYEEEQPWTETTTDTQDATSEDYTYDFETTTEMTTSIVNVEKIHFNSDGKLYGKKGTFSGLWPNLEAAARASNDSSTKALMEFVGDNTELKKSNYEEDKFKEINGYGTVHWSQSGHKWPNRYSCAASGYLETSNNSSAAFDSIKDSASAEIDTSSTKSGGTLMLDEIVLSDSAVSEEPTVEKTTAENKTSQKAASSVKSYTSLSAGKVWGSNACSVCSLAMALSTLSGVTVSPPEVALAANLLIGKSAWYDTIMYSKTQAKLAQLAGFPVYMEPYTSAKKSTLDDCLNKNGVALFVTNKSAWVSGNGRHYIMVRNKVGDKYYTADSGKNPTKGFTYEEISSGYCQQYIVYIYPKQ